MRFFIYGIVQGVGFRPAVYTLARRMGLRGYVRNNGSNVEVCVDRDGEEFIGSLLENLPPLAVIERIHRVGDPEVPEPCPGHPVATDSGPGDSGAPNDNQGALSSERSAPVDPDLVHSASAISDPGFVILPSTAGARTSSIPVDTALCEPCIEELLEPENRRYLYPFTNCTDCGARYTVIRDLPYDRRSTTMAPYPLCPSCAAEYTDPGNRRLHAQTVSCPDCGPRYTLYDARGSPMTDDDPFSTFARAIEAGELCVLKGWGGMHILSSLHVIPGLRKRYGRETKPFALMLRDLATVRKYVNISGYEEELLASAARPILLLPGKQGFGFLEDAAPGLDTVGIMLPCAGAHHILFRHLTGDGVVATSANLPGEAMITTNREVFSLGMDRYLLHDREIAQRADDSLMKVYHGQDGIPVPLFIRKSRGHVPVHLELPFDTPLLAVGPERNVTGAVVSGSRLFLTPYIGNTRNYSNLMFLESALDHLRTLTGARQPETVVRDMHPGYASNRVARALADRFGSELVEIQHHHAHAASLLLDHRTGGGSATGSERGHPADIRELVVLTLDGAGYGPDGTVWGGEVLWTNGPEYRRIGTLVPVPMPGGDLAVRNPRRMVFALGELTGHPQPWPRGTEADILGRSMATAPRTTGMGRILDSLCCLLGGWCRRTYDGEPAMRLEPLLARGGFVPGLVPEARIMHREGSGPFESGGVRVVDQMDLFGYVFRMTAGAGGPVGSSPPGRDACDLAHTMVRRIVEGLVTIACDHAESRGLAHIGLSGGVAYSLPLVRMVDEAVRERGLVPVFHGRLPPGDGGISAGQVYAAGLRDED